MLFCGININVTQREELFKEADKFRHLIPVNAEGIVQAHSNSRLMQILNSNYTTIDGQIPLWLYRFKYPKSSIVKLSGSDIIYDLSEWALSNGYRVFLLGGKKESNDGALKRLKDLYPNIEIEGYSPVYEPYPFSEKNNSRIREKILSFHPQLLFVGFGMGKQEFWIDDNRCFLEDTGVKCAVGCGGTFEFVSGQIKRAPFWMQRLGMESIWRLLCEPRMFRVKRILLSFKIFKYL